MGVSRNNIASLTQNDLTAYVVALGKRDVNRTVSLASDSANQASSAIRLDASFDKGLTWITSISLSDPNAALGAAFVASLAPGESANTQDRCFGATHVRVVRTDANGGVCKATLTINDN